MTRKVLLTRLNLTSANQYAIQGYEYTGPTPPDSGSFKANGWVDLRVSSLLPTTVDGEYGGTPFVHVWFADKRQSKGGFVEIDYQNNEAESIRFISRKPQGQP